MPAMALDASSPEAPRRAPAELSFELLYDQHVDFVWRSLRRLGVAEDSVDDAVQEVFLVVHRRLGEFEGKSSLKTWLFGIALRVAHNQRRSVNRARTEELRDSLVDIEAPGPHEATAEIEAREILYDILQQIDEDKRAPFILSELEQLKGSEIAEALGINQNTLYSRLRAAREQFEAALKRHHSRDTWRQRWTP